MGKTFFFFTRLPIIKVLQHKRFRPTTDDLDGRARVLHVQKA